jgi:hypothetical protein
MQSRAVLDSHGFVGAFGFAPAFAKTHPNAIVPIGRNTAKLQVTATTISASHSEY